MKNDGLVLLGAIGGGVVGFFLATFLLQHFSIEAMAVPGGLVGLGAGIVKSKSTWVAVVCGIIALAVGTFTRWHSITFIADPSFGYFLTHMYNLPLLTLVMLAVGTFIGFWVPYRRK